MDRLERWVRFAVLAALVLVCVYIGRARATIEQFANNASTTINHGGGYSSGDTSIVVTSATGFPSANQYRILIGTEILIVTGGAGTTTWTVSRGAESTSAASIANGATVTHIVTAGSLAHFKQDTNIVDTYANEPAYNATGNGQGATFWPTDGFSAWANSGSAWLPFGPLLPLTQPPAASNFTQRKNASTTCTLTDNKGGLYFSETERTTSDDDCLEYEAIPLTSSHPYPYTLTVGYMPLYGGQGASTAGCFSYGEIGIMVFEASSKDIEAMHLFADSQCSVAFQYLTQTDVNGSASSAGQVTGTTIYSSGGPVRWMQIKDDATNRALNVSSDGVHWATMYSHAHATNFSTAPDNAGLFLNARGMNVAMQVVHFSLTAP